MPTSCSTSSHESGEHLFATATRADFWFLLEHPGVYGADALAESLLPEPVKARLEAAAASVPNGRIQLIKQSSAGSQAGLSFFVAVNHEEQPNLYEFHLDRVEDLLDLDLPAIAREDPAFRGHDRSEPLFLVCTNGKRDACCASLGLPLYRALRQQYGDAVWQTAHVGGHRFAPNLVALPAGVFYGYLSPEAAQETVAAAAAGRIHLPNYRGRSCYAEPVQAGEAFLRRETAQDGLLRFRLVESQELPGPVWILQFVERFSGEMYCVQIRSETGAVSVKKSCSDPAPGPIRQFRLEEIRALPAVQ